MNKDWQDFKNQVDDFLSATTEARLVSERDRNFYDGYQWSESELGTLRSRKQVPITVNRVKPKVEGLKGLLAMRKTDIKAFPRNYGQDEESAHAVTDALRYVADNTGFNDDAEVRVFEDRIIQGYGGVIVDVSENSGGDIDVNITRVPWDRLYFDPHSSRHDFKDVKFSGVMIWMDIEDVKESFPNADLNTNSDSDSGDWTFDDKPRWMIKQNDRVRVRIAHHFYLEAGVWKMVYFSDKVLLSDPIDSPYLDEFGVPTNPIEIESCYIDSNNNRYSEVSGMIDLQREINHRRSKSLHLLSTRQTAGRKGSVKDIAAMKRELAKPNGHIEYQGEKAEFEILSTGDFSQGQMALYQDAKQELDSTSFNAQLSGERSSGDLSGKAIDRLQSAGSLEVNSLFVGQAAWKKRVFRQVWCRIKQFWTEEKWVRIADDQDNLRWVGFNTQIKVQDLLEQTINDDSKPLEMRQGAAMMFTKMMNDQDPRLQQIVETKNDVAELDVDIMLDLSFDVVNTQQEQFQIIAQFAQTSKDIDIIELIELSNLRNKDELVDKIEARRKANAEAQGGAMQMKAQAEQTKNAKVFADAQVASEKAKQTAIENQILISSPKDKNPQVTT